MEIEIRHRFTETIILSGNYDSVRDCLEKNRGADLRGADLGGADVRGVYLRGVYLRGADLRGVYLRDADLRGAEGYQDSHEIFKEIVRRQKLEVFTETEWSAIGIITIHNLCWDSIKKRFGNVMGRVFEVLAKEGFTEWLEHWNSLA